MEFSEIVDFVGCKEDEGLRPNGVLQCNFKGVSILMKSNPFLKSFMGHCTKPSHLRLFFAFYDQNPFSKKKKNYD